MRGGVVSGWGLIRLGAIAVYAFMFLPVAVVVILAFNANQFGAFPIEGMSLRWFAALADNEAILRAFRVSVTLGLSTAAVSTTLGVLAALALVRFDFPGKGLVSALLIAPILVPEVVLAVALLLFLRFLDLPKSFALLLCGHVIFTLPFVVLVVQARLVAVKREFEEAAMSLGAGPLETFRQVTLPLIAPAVLAGMLFAFTISFDDITGTLFWKPGGVETVPTQIFAMLRNSISPEINALGAAMVLLTAGIPLIGSAIMRRMARDRGG